MNAVTPPLHEMPRPSELERRAVGKVTRRLIPFLVILFIVNFLDRTNVGFAALAMRHDLGMTAVAYGLGAGIFFIGYLLLEAPSNLGLYRFGARRWLARIVVSWEIVAASMAFVHTTAQFVTLRFLLGCAEAGFYPGIIYYLSTWYPARDRARAAAAFYLGVPLAQIIGAPMSSALMLLGDHGGFTGWPLMYFAEGLPAIALGVAAAFILRDRPAEAEWLAEDERSWLMKAMAEEERGKQQPVAARLWIQLRRSLSSPLILALALVYFGVTMGSNAMNFFLPSVLQSLKLQEGRPLGPMSVGALTAVPYLVAAVVMVIWGRHSDRSRERRYHVGTAAIAGALGLGVAFTFGQPAAVVSGFIILAAGIYSAINVFWAVPPQLLAGASAAAGIGVINSIGNLSGFVGPYLTGFLDSKTGSYAPGFLVIAALVFGAGAGLIWLLSPRNAWISRLDENAAAL